MNDVHIEAESGRYKLRHREGSNSVPLSNSPGKHTDDTSGKSYPHRSIQGSCNLIILLQPRAAP